MSDAKDTEIMSQYEAYSVEELKEALKAIFLFSELNDADIEEMDQIMAVLRKKAPFYYPHTTEEMWAEFQADYAEELANIGIRKNEDTEEVVNEAPAVDLDGVRSEPEAEAESSAVAAVRVKNHRKVFRIGLIAAAVVALMAIIAITASAMGFNLWGWVPKWNNEDLRFVAEDAPSKGDLEDIPTALAVLNIHEPLYPTWLPEDLEQTESILDSDPLFLHEAFQGDDRFLSITISPADDAETMLYQKEANPPLEYIAGNAVHYIFDNTTEIIAVWYTENYTTVIAGNISIEEMKEIIDSLYEVKK